MTTIDELIDLLRQVPEGMKYNGDLPVRIECAINGVRVEQDIMDVVQCVSEGKERLILVSKEALDADPLLDLPKDNPLTIVPDQGGVH